MHVSVANAGISGDTTNGMMNRIDSAVRRGTKLVLIAITNNNSRRGVGSWQHAANTTSIVAHIRALGTKLIMVRFSDCAQVVSVEGGDG